MKNTLRFSTRFYTKVLISLILVITMVTSSLPIAYAVTTHPGVLGNANFDESSTAPWSKADGEITVKNGEGVDGTNALELTADNNAVYQTVKRDGDKEYPKGTTFEWRLKCKSPTSNDIGALVLGTNTPTATEEKNDQLRQMMTWIKDNKRINNNIPANGKYSFVVYSKTFIKNGDFNVAVKNNFSLVPTIQCKEKFSVTLFRTTATDWQTVDNSDNTKFTFNNNFQSINFSLISYNGNPLVDDVDLTVIEPETHNEVVNNLRNGSFEEPNIRDYYANKGSKTNFYLQTKEYNVPSWNTTAYGELIELFDDDNQGNTSHFPKGNRDNRKVYERKQAAELNADEPSTLYQYINTESGSRYKWSLAHRGRAGADIMALIIGPKQFKENSETEVNLKKEKASDKDHFMQMVKWIKENKADFGKEKEGEIDKLGETDVGLSKESTTELKPIEVTVYSRRFADKGKFVDGTDENFSATESTVFSQKWDVTIMCSGNAKWHEYGYKEEGYSFYDVPEGQDESIFAFTSYRCTTSEKDPNLSTYGNLLDGINFELYYPARSISYTGGVADLSYEYNGTPDTRHIGSGESTDSIWVDDNSTFTLEVTPNFATITNENGEEVPRVDANDNPIQNAFLGAYITINGKRKYYPATAVNADDKAIYFSETENDDGSITYSYGQSNVSGRVVVELVYSEVYTMTYNSNGGNPYSVQDGTIQSGNMDWNGSNANVARFYESVTCEYTSIACEWWENNPAVVFKGWELVGGEIYQIELDGKKTPLTNTKEVLFAGDAKVEHSVNDNENVFIITDKNNKYEGRVDAKTGGVLVANWEYKTSVIAQTEQLDGSFIDSGVGGQVSLTKHTTSVTVSNVNGNVNGNNREYDTDSGISDCDKFTYSSPFNNEITISSTANEHYAFYGWFDGEGNRIASSKDHSYTVDPYYTQEEKGKKPQTLSTIYARFIIGTQVRFHINDEDTVPTTGDPNADLFRVYYPKTVTISAENNTINDRTSTTYTLHNLDENNRISEFYKIPVPKSQHGKIFKGWYKDKNSDGYPIKWDDDKFKGENDIYAHWIDVGTVEKDATDTKISQVIDQSTVKLPLPGIDLLGVQIRYEEKDDNYPGGRGDGPGKSPHFDTDGLRFITCIKESVLSDAGNLFKTTYGSYKKKSLSYGYVIAKESKVNEAKEQGKLKDGDCLEYKGTDVNGDNTTQKYSFVQNVNCTSQNGNFLKDSVVEKDHRNFTDYRIYSLVVTYKKDGKTDKEIADAKGQYVIARPYLRYQDANGLYRTYYQDYKGTNVYGGCSTNYNAAKDFLSQNNYFPKPKN